MVPKARQFNIGSNRGNGHIKANRPSQFQADFLQTKANPLPASPEWPVTFLYGLSLFAKPAPNIAL